MGKIAIECDVGEVSDGYHTFNELYAHRCVLFACLMKSYKSLSWKSRKHDDGSSYEGWFVAGIDLSSGTVTYHLPDSYWDKLNVEELDNAKYDGHTSIDVLARLTSWLEKLT